MEDLDVCIYPSTMKEVKAAIKAMKSGKACGADGVTAEMLKAEETETPRLWMCIFERNWKAKRFLKRERADSLSNYPKRVICVTGTTGEA